MKRLSPMVKERATVKHSLWLVALCAAVAVTGCIPSLHPLYTEEDLIFEPALIGTWEDGDRWTFEKSGELEYRLTVSNDDDDPVVFEARLTRLGSYRFLDLYPDAREVVEHFYPTLIPTHVFFRLEMEGDTLQIVSLDESWLIDKIDTGEITMTHAFVDLPHHATPRRWRTEFLLTASTEELQALVVKYADHPDAFSTEGPDAAAWELHRQ